MDKITIENTPVKTLIELMHQDKTLRDEIAQAEIKKLKNKINNLKTEPCKDLNCTNCVACIVAVDFKKEISYGDEFYGMKLELLDEKEIFGFQFDTDDGILFYQFSDGEIVVRSIDEDICFAINQYIKSSWGLV
ncbi:MAG: hypothetical protein LBT91_02615 [Bifidobacteriaceae bacterium]|jgi:hypothetical protein|nr:hypothetical protein [Bifidobacteriaceae bacterium]